MKRPLLYIVFAFIMGIAAYDGSAVAALVCCAAVMGICVFLFRSENRILCLILPFVMIAGFADCYAEDCIYIDYDNPQIFEGIVTEKAEGSFTLKADEKIIVYSNDDMENIENLKQGYRVKLYGIPRKPERCANPFGYDSYRVSMSNGIRAILYYPDILELSKEKNISFLMGILRERAERVFDENLKPEYAGIMKAMIIGNTGELDGYTKDLYKCAGMYHILAISGMHIGILFYFIKFIIKPFGKNISFAVSIFVIIFYCIFTGAGTSTLRAAFMFSVMIMGRVYGRDIDDISLICFAMLFMLILNPFRLFGIGFQYSFCAVISIALVSKPLFKTVDERYQNGFVSALILIFSVCLCIKPITAYYFYYFNTVDILVNAMLFPFTSVLVIYGFMGCILGSLSGILGKIIISQVNAILIIFESVFEKADNFPVILVGRPYFFEIVMFYAVIFLFVKYIQGKKFYHLAGFCVLFAFVAVMPFSRYAGGNDVEAAYLSIGQGDCTVIRHKNVSFIIDCGERYGESSDFLQGSCQNTVEMVFISHSDLDHCQGFEYLAKHINVKNVVLPDIPDDIKDDVYRDIIKCAEENGINVIYSSEGDSFRYGKLNFKILSPNEESHYGNPNEASMVVKAEYGKNSLLFTGDITSDVEMELLDKDVSSDVLKIAHHGSKYSSGEDFLKAVNPKFTVISAGKNNNYGHPSPEVIERLEELNMEYRVTAWDGAVILRLDGKNVTLKH